MSETIYNLKDPFEYSHKGDMVKANFVTLVGPNYKQMEHVIPIKQSFMNAVKNISSDIDEDTLKEAKEKAQEKEDNDSFEVTGPEVMQMLYGSSEKVFNLFLHAEQLWKSGAGLIDGETNFTIPLIQKLSPRDAEGLLGTYISVFIAPSLTDGQ